MALLFLFILQETRDARKEYVPLWREVTLKPRVQCVLHSLAELTRELRVPLARFRLLFYTEPKELKQIKGLKAKDWLGTDSWFALTQQ